MLAAQLSKKERDLIAVDYLADIASIFATQYRQMISRDRQALLKSVDVTRVDVPSAPEDRVSIYERISAWKEFAPTLGFDKAVMDMARKDLVASLNARTKKLMTEFWITEVQRRLVQGLERDDELVKDRYTEDDVANLFMNVRKEMARGNLRIRIQHLAALPSTPPVPPQARGRRPV